MSRASASVLAALALLLALPGRAAAQRDDGPKISGTDEIEAALGWLARHQSKDGSWDSDGWPRRCGQAGKGPKCGKHARNAGAAHRDVGATSLALLAFLGHGHTHKFGKWKTAVRPGLEWLRRQQKEDGSIGVKGKPSDALHDHALATQALCEASYLTRDADLQEPARRARDYCLKARDAGGGWKGDAALSAAMVLALKAARLAGLESPPELNAELLAFFAGCTDPTGKVPPERAGAGASLLTGEKGKFDEVPTLTAAATICRIFLGERRSAAAVKQGAAIVAAAPPAWPKGGSARRCHFYYWFYGTYATFQLGGATWTSWRKALLEALLPNQRSEGCEAGSWLPVDPWSVAGGRVYATAINVLSLQMYYRYERAQGDR